MNDFEEIFAQNYDIVYGYIMKRCADPHLAEEITQQAFFNAFLYAVIIRSKLILRLDCLILGINV